jgi:hypothetical protein
MFETVYKSVRRSLGVLAGALGAVAAILTSVGYLAEHSHLKMLGFTILPLDFNSYLVTGARCLLYVVVGFVFQVFRIVMNVIADHPGLGLLGGIALVTSQLPPVRRPVRRWVARFKSAVGTASDRYRVQVLLGLILLQLMALFQLVGPADATNLLFEPTPFPSTATDAAQAAKTDSTQVAIDSLPAPSRVRGLLLGDKTEALRDHLGWLLVLSAGCGLLVWAAVRSGRRAAHETVPSPWVRIWMGANLVLFGVQVFLLPVNYGILAVPNRFPLVEITARDTTLRNAEWTRRALLLLHQDGDAFYLYDRVGARVWLMPRGDVRTVAFEGVESVFAPRLPPSVQTLAPR